LTTEIFHSISDKVTKEQFIMLGGYENKYDDETTRRVAKFAEELQRKRMYDKFTTFETKSDNLVVAHDLKLFSFCEHHLLPFFGVVNIGYIPFGRVCGLSKMQRVVDKIASKPSIQENLTDEIASFFMKTVESPHCIVQVKAIHTCVIARGTESTNAQFTTTSINGNFKDKPATRNEFYQTLNSNEKLRIF
jgi:GTP cyclohydrolase IA